MQAEGNGSTLPGLLSQASHSLEAARLWAAAELNEPLVLPSLPNFDLAKFYTSFLSNFEDLQSRGDQQSVMHATTQFSHWPCYSCS